MRSTLLIVARRSRWMPMMWQPARARKLPTASPKPLEAPRIRAHPVRAGIETEAGGGMGRGGTYYNASRKSSPAQRCLGVGAPKPGVGAQPDLLRRGGGGAPG